MANWSTQGLLQAAFNMQPFFNNITFKPRARLWCSAGEMNTATAQWRNFTNQEAFASSSTASLLILQFPHYNIQSLKHVYDHMWIAEQRASPSDNDCGLKRKKITNYRKFNILPSFRIKKISRSLCVLSIAYGRNAYLFNQLNLCIFQYYYFVLNSILLRQYYKWPAKYSSITDTQQCNVIRLNE